MRKYALHIYLISMLLMLILSVVFLSVFFINKDSYVTEHITMKYFESSLNNFNEDNLKEFVAKSENDVLYKNVVNKYQVYNHEGVSDYHFSIDKYEEFGNGKYQCYFNLKNVPTCDLEHEGRYMNYLIETTTTYTNSIGKTSTIKEKGLVVFIKDGSKGNMFEWKLVRYNSYEV